MKTLKFFLLIILFVPVSFVYASNTSIPTIHEQEILHNAPTLDPNALKYAIEGYQWALSKHGIRNPNVLTVIDFNKPSNEKRLWVIDLQTNAVLIKAYTTHGKGSGVTYATSFSNSFNTDKTSLGVYESMKTYQGEHGLSLRMQGLENGINNNAYRRTVVIHPAWYATPKFVKANNRAGRSWGCFAIDPAISTQLVNAIKNGSIIFAYATSEQSDPNLKND